MCSMETRSSRIRVRVLSSVQLDGVRSRRTRTRTCNCVRETLCDVNWMCTQPAYTYMRTRGSNNIARPPEVTLTQGTPLSLSNRDLSLPLHVFSNPALNPKP
jgi:hypothetical protein